MKRSKAPGNCGSIIRRISARSSQEFPGLKDLNLKVARAWAAKELFSKFWEYQQEGWARRFFKDWFGWMSRSRLKPMIEVAQMLKRHLENLLTYLEPPYHQRGDRRIELENPEHQISGPRLSQLPQLPDSDPVLLRKAQSLPTMIREESK